LEIAVNTFNTVLYAGNTLGPKSIVHNTDDLYESGFTTVLLDLFHIGRGPDTTDPVKGQKTGDIVFNDPNDQSDPGLIVISDGAYQGPPAWPEQLQQLFATSGNGRVTRMGCSVGGGGCEDYQTIWGKFVVNGSIGSDTALYQNFVTLKKALPFVDFIDIDCEEFGSDTYPDYSWTETIVAFGSMLKEIGFNLTFCPYNSITEWMALLKGLHTPQEPTVVWLNLQCYDGGYDNDPADWATEINEMKIGVDGAAFTMPGLWCCNTSKPWTGSTPPEVEKRFATWKKTPPLEGLQGGFIWNYEDILGNESSTDCNPKYSGPKTAAAYQQAIVAGLEA
jgi:hypothetical protein